MDKLNKNINLEDLVWYEDPYDNEHLIGISDDNVCYAFDVMDGSLISIVTSGDNIKKEFYECSLEKAIKVQNKYKLPIKLKNYIDSCCERKEYKISGTNYNFYYVVLDRIIAIDENDNCYECYIDRMEPCNQKLDKKDLSYLKPGEVLHELELVTQRKERRIKLMALKEQSIKFEDIYAYISPNGVIGGISKKNNNDEYILSYSTGFLQNVKKGEGYDRKWEKCNAEKFYSISEKLQDKLKKLEKAENQYDPDWDLFEPFREIRIESLDLYCSKNNVIYGKNDKNELYVLDNVSGNFEKSYEYFEHSSKDQHCKIYEAYEEKAKIINKKSIPETEDVPVKKVPIKLENLKLFIEPSNILLEPRVVGLDKHGRVFEISHYSGKIIPIEGESPIKENWSICSLEKAKEIQNHFIVSQELKEYIKHSSEKAYSEKNQVFGKDFRFYLSDIDKVYAIDENGTEYFCGSDFMTVLDKESSIDPMWGGLSQNDVMYYIKNY